MRKYFFIWLFITLFLTSIPQNNIVSTTTPLSLLSHFFFYATLSLFFLFSFKSSKRIMFLVILLIAAFDEIHQFFIPGRNPSLMDFLTDLLGGIFVCLNL